MFIFLKFINFLAFATVISATNNVDFNALLTVGFFQRKSLQMGYVFDCLQSKERILLRKALFTNNLRIFYEDLSKNNFHGQIAKFPDVHLGIIFNYDCPNSVNLLRKMENLNLFDEKHHWLIFSTNLSDKKISTLNLNINSEVYAINLNEDNKNYAVYDLYNPAFKRNGVLVKKEIGFYDVTTGLFEINTKTNKYWRRRNMTGITLNSMIVLRSPHEGKLDDYIRSDKNRRIDSFDRFQCHINLHCRDLYNFTMNISETDSWGYNLGNNKFDGLVGALLSKEIDVTCSGIFYKKERIPLLDYGRGIWKHRTIIIFREPTTRSFAQIFLRPMTSSVWFATLLIVVLIVATLSLALKYQHHVAHATVTAATDEQTRSGLILFVLGAFCQQGYPIAFQLLCTRITAISILIFCFLFYQFYSGSIVSLLLVKPPSTIKNAQDLLKSSLQIGSDDVPYYRDYFKKTSDPLAIEMYKKKILGEGQKSNFFNGTLGMELVKKSNFAFQVEETTAYNIIEDTFSDKAKCELREIIFFPTKTLYVALQKGSPFSEMFNVCVQRVVEHGLGYRQRNHWKARKPHCLQSSQSITFRVDLNEMYPPLVMLLLGIFLSLVVLSLELLFDSKKRTKTTKLPEFLN